MSAGCGDLCDIGIDGQGAPESNWDMRKERKYVDGFLEKFCCEA